MAPADVLPTPLREQLSGIVTGDTVVLFMKGNRFQPQCGFSARVVEILDGLVPEYTTVDVLQNPDIRNGIKEFSDWPTLPQLYVNGEFLGGCDIITQMASSGELHETLGIEVAQATAPELSITPAAVEAIRRVAQQDPPPPIRFRIASGFRYDLNFSQQRPGDAVVTIEGLQILIDPVTAAQAEGTTIDFQQQGMRGGFVFSCPAEPAPVVQMGPAEVKVLLDSDNPPALIDVRTPREVEIASIEGARLLDAAAEQWILQQPKDTVLVFHCHHGIRSQQAAEAFRVRGFSQTINLAGGIDAWSNQVDPSVPRY